ncbi:MAG: translation initiation factor IF-2 [Firmicutes bacterium]|nr:translation initiation factor IF-2 [Bacillota bacterium]
MPNTTDNKNKNTKAPVPAGKPLPKSASQQPKTAPAGTPLRKSAVPSNAAKMADEAAKAAAAADEAKAASAEAAKAVTQEAAPVPAAAPAEATAGETKTAAPEAPKTAVKETKTAAKENAKTPAKEAKTAAKEAAKTPAKQAKPAPKEEAPKAEEPKASAKEEKPAEKQAPDYSAFVPNIGIKIVKRAADEPKEPPKPAAPKQERKPVEPKERKTSGSRGGKDQERTGNRNNGDRKDGKAPANGDRKPKEYTGNRKSGQQGGQQGDRRNGQAAGGARKFGPKSDNTQKVVAFTASPDSSDSRRGGRKEKPGKDKGDKRDRFDQAPADLSKTTKKKHSKYKEKVDLEPTAEQEIMQEAVATGSILINVPITLAGFCEQVEKSTSQAIMALMKMGIMANVNQNLDEETAVLLGMELGVSIMVNHNEAIEEEDGIDKSADRESDLLPRAPIVTVMGHVDHGKTSLLDAIRSTNVTAGEAGGITQHIGASEIEHNGQHIVFLDTPGHEAFTAMRARGAYITDIAVLVVAADDSVMPQTIESISHAKAANVPIIVAMNKMDKPTANPDVVKTDLSNHGILVEDWGGDTICVPVSAKTGMGIEELLEMILMQAEMLELKANPDRLAMGNVIEARLDKNRGPVATLLVTNGTLHTGASIVAGMASGRVRVMTNPKGDVIKKAGPSRAVEITGLTEVPEAGDEFFMVKDEKTAREITEKRKLKQREDVMAKSSAVSLEKLFSQMSEGDIKELNLIIKADVMGSVGALEQSLEKLHNENVRVRIIHTGVGAINESDIMLASTSNAVIIGFNVRPSSAVQTKADQEGVEIRTYRVIYEIIEDIEAAMKGMLDPEFKEVVLGKAEVRNTFKVSNVGTIAGSYVLEGKVTRSAKLRLVRDGIVVHEGEVGSLRRFKDDVREVASGFECGISIEKFNDIKEGDIIEAYTMEEVKRA